MDYIALAKGICDESAAEGRTLRQNLDRFQGSMQQFVIENNCKQ